MEEPLSAPARLGAFLSGAGLQREGEERPIGHSGLKKLLVKAGEGWESPNLGDEVTVDYIGSLIGGTAFESSRDCGKPFKLKLGQGQVVKGLDHCIATMKKGEKSVFTIPPALAYGQSGAGLVPPDATLKFDIELLTWETVIDICNDGGIQKKILAAGEKWATPKDADEVLVKYEVKLENGTRVLKAPVEGVQFYVIDGHLCPAIGKVVKTMKKGEKALVTVEPRYAFGGSGNSELAVPPDATLIVDIELLSWNVVEDVMHDGKVVKKVLEQGDGCDRPNEGALVRIRCCASLEDGTVLDRQAYNGGDLFEFIVGEEQVPAELEQAIATMKRGEKARITVAPDFVLEKFGLERGLVHPGSKLVYEVELESFIKEKETRYMTALEKLEVARKRKDEGNILFNGGKYERASRKYTKAARIVQDVESVDPGEQNAARSLKASCDLNNAACKLKLREFKQAANLCTTVLQLESQNVKALYRRAQAYIETADLELAESDLKRALELDPNSRELRSERKRLKQRQAEFSRKEASMYRNVFARSSQ